MKDKPPVVCLGIMVADIVARPLRTVPDAGRLVLVDEMGLYTGGCAVNAAFALARMGIPVEVIGRIGSDPLGEYLLEGLAAEEVGTGGVVRDSQVGTSATMVMVEPDGERRFVHYLGANAHLRKTDVDMDRVTTASILHVAGSLVMPGIDGEPTAALLREARAAGVTTFLDTVWDDTGSWMRNLSPCLPNIDFFVPSLPEARALTGREIPVEIAGFLLDKGVGTVAIKMGAAGCLLMQSGGEAIRIPAYQVDVVDATGAGDAFAAGFIAGLWLDWSIERSARLANAVGALCVTGVGASGGVRSLADTIQFMTTTPLIQARTG